MDATIAVPERFWFPIQKALSEYHLATNKDLLIAARPVWLQTFVWCEILLQAPFFLAAIYSLTRDHKKIYLAMLVYGVEGFFTTIACLAELYFLNGVTEPQRYYLIALYAPTAVIPLFIALDMYGRISEWVPKVDVVKKNA